MIDARKPYRDDEVTPPRCMKCNEPVSLNKRDCACTRALIEAFNLGAACWKSGGVRADCSYDSAEPEYAAWIDGYNFAAQDNGEP